MATDSSNVLAQSVDPAGGAYALSNRWHQDSPFTTPDLELKRRCGAWWFLGDPCILSARSKVGARRPARIALKNDHWPMLRYPAHPSQVKIAATRPGTEGLYEGLNQTLIVRLEQPW